MRPFNTSLHYLLEMVIKAKAKYRWGGEKASKLQPWALRVVNLLFSIPDGASATGL